MKFQKVQKRINAFFKEKNKKPGISISVDPFTGGTPGGILWLRVRVSHGNWKTNPIGIHNLSGKIELHPRNTIRHIAMPINYNANFWDEFYAFVDDLNKEKIE